MRRRRILSRHQRRGEITGEAAFGAEGSSGLHLSQLRRIGTHAKGVVAGAGDAHQAGRIGDVDHGVGDDTQAAAGFPGGAAVQMKAAIGTGSEDLDVILFSVDLETQASSQQSAPPRLQPAGRRSGAHLGAILGILHGMQGGSQGRDCREVGGRQDSAAGGGKTRR